MRPSSYRIAGLIVLGLSSATATAKDGISGKLGLGAIAASGNSESTNLQFDSTLRYDRGDWHNKLTAKANFASSEVTDEVTGDMRKQTTAERYVFGARSALDFSEFDFLFVQLDLEKDLYGGVRERSVESVGYGRRLIKTDAHKLDVELGAGARQSLAQQAGAQRENELVGRAGLNYLWAITQSNAFEQSVTVESGRDNTYTESVSSLKLAVIGSVFANLGFTVKNNSDVPVGTEKTDTISSVSLSYEF